MNLFLKFVAAMADELWDLFVYSKNVASGGAASEEYERQLAARIIRKASDEQMRRELSGE